MSTKVTVASISIPAIEQVCAYAEENRTYHDLDFRIHYIGGDKGADSSLESDIAGSDVLVIDLMGASKDIVSRVVSSAKKCKGQRLTFGGMAPSIGRLGGYDAARFWMNQEDEEILHQMAECWKRAERSDIEYILNTVLGRYLQFPGISETEYPGCRDGVFIRDPMILRDYASREEYFSDVGRSTEGYVMLVYSGNSYPTRTISAVRMLFERLKEKVDVLPVAANSYNIGCMDSMREIAGRPEAIVNVLPFRFLAGPMGGDSESAVELLEELDVPCLSPFFMTHKSRSDWEADRSGLDPTEFMLNIFLPELDGALCTIPVGTNEVVTEIDDYGLDVTDVVPLEDRIDRIVGKVMSYLNLRWKPNAEKRVAILSYNYPPGEGNLFGGSFLNGSGSISSILSTLHDAGYSTDPMSPDDVLDRSISGGLLNGGEWITPGDSVIRYWNGDPHSEDVVRAWGEAPGGIMVSDGDYLIPGILDGNVFIGLQPPRTSDESKASEDYHDPTLPPHHQYLAVYEWIRDVFEADAIIHLGTHGTVEFLPGKESAVSSECYPDRLLGDMVHIYAYYSGNPSEAMIAKRRSHSCMVSYMSPPFVRSGIYGDMVELEEWITEYRESLHVDAGRSETLMEAICTKAKELRLPEDIDELEDELVSIRESLIPRGLHVFGESFDEEEAVSYAAHAMEYPHDGVIQLGTCFQDEEEMIRAISGFISSGEVPEDLKGNEDAVKALEYARSIACDSMASCESSGLLHALDGGYIGVKPGGDMMKDPGILPTGSNIIQFNPNNIPSTAAFDRGFQAAEEMISGYHDSTGEYPRSAALVLWGLETSRTQGLTIGQICGYLGLRMKRTSGDFTDRFEPIPLEELGRPRIDVVVSMCGFFRDMFPNLVTGIGRLFSMVSSLDEDEESNTCRANTIRNRLYLEEEGYKGDDLEELSECRLFGPARGEYGTSMTGLVEDSSWESEEELGRSFTDSLRFAYTSGGQVTDVPGLLQRNHTFVDLVSQVRDSVDREIIDLDHYYEFLGGLSKSVEMARGGKASVFVVDASRARVRTQDLRRSIEHGVRTRLLNPKWIEGLLDVKYHGAQNINDRFENVLGLAATTGYVDSGVFSDMLKCYVEDDDMRHRLMENNNWAYMSMLNRLSEAESRGYWKATQEDLDILKAAYIESEEMAEGSQDDED